LEERSVSRSRGVSDLLRSIRMTSTSGYW
jgi:hypothetical protein